MTALTVEQIQDLVKHFIEEELMQDETARALRTTAKVSRHDDPEYVDVAEEANDMVKADCYEALAKGNYSYIRNGADNILDDNNLTAGKDSLEYRILCRELLKGQIELCRTISKRNQGVYPTTYVPYNTSDNLYTPNVQISNVDKKQKVLISTAFKLYVDDKKIKGHWTPKTVLDISDKVNVFIELLGDIKLCDITQERLRAAEQALFNFPKNRKKVAKYRDLSTEEIKMMTVPEAERLSRLTIKNYINQINGFMSWLKTMYELPEWTAAILSTPKGDKTEDASTSKAVFSTSDLNTMFNDKWYVTGATGIGRNNRKQPLNGAKFWLPLMALYSGARLEELCQLYLTDFKIIDDVKCCELTSVIEDKDGNTAKVKSLKNSASKRVVPLHDHLLNLGLWEYVQELKESGHTRLFEELTFSDSGMKYSHNFSKWFNNHLRNHLNIHGNTKEGSKVFYSFRHTFINYCVQRGIDDKFFERVVGHKIAGNDITHRHYAKQLSPKTLKAEVIDKIDYEIDLSQLESNPFARVKK